MFQLIQLILQNLTFFALHLKNLTSFPKPLSAQQKLYNIEYLRKIADIYNINITCLLDDYMMFMYKGQGKQIKSLRKSLGLTQDKLADLFNTPKSNIKHWEHERSFMQYDNFVKIKRFFDI